MSDRKLMTVIALLLVLSIGFGGTCTGYSRYLGQEPQRESISSQTDAGPANSGPCRAQMCKAANKTLYVITDSYSGRMERGASHWLEGGSAGQLSESLRALSNGRPIYDRCKDPSSCFPPVFLITCSFLC